MNIINKKEKKVMNMGEGGNGEFTQRRNFGENGWMEHAYTYNSERSFLFPPFSHGYNLNTHITTYSLSLLAQEQQRAEPRCLSYLFRSVLVSPRGHILPSLFLELNREPPLVGTRKPFVRGGEG